MPYERDNAKERENSRRKGWVLGDLEAWHAIQVTCTKCSRQSFVAPHELHARYRPQKIIGAIKCSGSGGHHRKLVGSASWELAGDGDIIDLPSYGYATYAVRREQGAWRQTSTRR